MRGANPHFSSQDNELGVSLRVQSTGLVPSGCASGTNVFMIIILKSEPPWPGKSVAAAHRRA